MPPTGPRTIADWEQAAKAIACACGRQQPGHSQQQCVQIRESELLADPKEPGVQVRFFSASLRCRVCGHVHEMQDQEVIDAPRASSQA